MQNLNQEQLNKRREPKWVIDPRTVTQEEERRLIRWAHAKASKYEDRMSLETPHGMIIADGDVEPEDADVGAIYGFKDLHWILFKEGMTFSFQLFSRKLILLKVKFAKI